jgi:hypothetical protein
VAETLGFCREVAGFTMGVASRQGRGSDGCVGFMWSWLFVGEVEAVPSNGMVKGVLQVLRLGSAMAMCSA